LLLHRRLLIEKGSWFLKVSGSLGEMASFQGQATVALFRVFDWLHFVCFCAEIDYDIPNYEGCEGWHAIQMQTKMPEAWMRNWAAYTGGLRYSEEALARRARRAHPRSLSCPIPHRRGEHPHLFPKHPTQQSKHGSHRTHRRSLDTQFPTFGSFDLHSTILSMEQTQ
jgi:hypothetical protein